MSFLSLTQEWREWLEQQHSWDEERVLQHQQWIQVREATVTFHFSWLDPIPPIPPKFTLKPFLPILPVTLLFTQQDRNLQNWRCAIPAAELHDIAGAEGTSNQIWKKKKPIYYYLPDIMRRQRRMEDFSQPWDARNEALIGWNIVGSYIWHIQVATRTS